MPNWTGDDGRCALCVEGGRQKCAVHKRRRQASTPTKLRATARFSDDGARYSDDGRFRLWLDINLASFPGGGCSPRIACALMMNPSTAHVDADGYLVPDPTVTKMCGYAVREGCGRLLVVNAFGVRLTDSKLLHKQPTPVGNPLNDMCIREALLTAQVRFIAWGNLHKSLAYRAAALRTLLRGLDVPVHALAINLDGSPGHPLYLSTKAPLLVFTP